MACSSSSVSMLRPLLITTLLSAVFLSGCSSSPSGSSSAEVHAEQDVLIIDGYISEHTVASVQALAEQQRFSTIRVNSHGGEPLASLQLGGWVHREKLDIEVTGQCLQACANYLFTAAQQKTIHSGAIVAWSGGALEESWTQQYSNYWIPGVRHVVEQYMDRFLRREIRFFERIGVDQRITVFGYHKLAGCDTDTMEGFYYSIPTLLRLGVDNVHTPQTSWQEAFTHYGAQFCKVELSSELEVITF